MSERDAPEAGSAPPAQTGGAHKNDMYGNIDARDEGDEGVLPPIPAATVVLMRAAADADGVEVLMLKKNSKITFGGMWVFPGGKIDAADADGVGDDPSGEQTARAAAARETQEEAGLEVEPNEFVWLAHWTPPPGPQKRFATWFFVAHIDRDDEIVIDDGEIKDHAWIRPADALARHANHEIDLVPPTWVTLYQLSLYDGVDAVLARLAERTPPVYSTRVVKDGDGVRVAMWHGDAGYESWDADVPGGRHRLVMAQDGFVFENTEQEY